MKNSSKRRPKVDIQIIKTESLQKPPETAQPQETGSVIKPTLSINILGTQQLREQVSFEDLQAVLEQMAQDFQELLAPWILQAAQQARQAGRIDEAMLTLRHFRLFATTREIEQELGYCLNSLHHLEAVGEIHKKEHTFHLPSRPLADPA